MMKLQDKKILVTGGAGFLGRHVVLELEKKGVPRKNIFVYRSKGHDLRSVEVVKKQVKGMDIVIHLAAKVGGIGYNRDHPAEMFYDNIMTGTHLIHEAWRAGVEKFVGIGTVCCYPKFTPVPFREEDLWNGYPEETNAPYGLAKKMLLVQSQAYRQQYGFNEIFLIPVNLYGPYDNFDLNTSHVLPALIRKFIHARDSNEEFVEVWGSGSATREFLYVEDAARGIILATENYESGEPVNLGTGVEMPIKEIAELIIEITHYKGSIHWDTTKPDGQPRRKLDVTKARRYFNFEAKIPFRQGLIKTIEWYENNKKKSW